MNTSRRSFLGATAAAAAATILTSAETREPPPTFSKREKNTQFIVAALTMLDKRRRFDDVMNRDYLAYLRESGVEGVLVLGTTGEFPSFSVAERKRILESFAKHRGDLTLICHAGTANIPETLDLLVHAADTGASSALIVPPFYYKKPPIEGLVAYYSPILEAAQIPVLVYNIPQLSGVAITMELLEHLSRFESLAGMKDSFNPTEAHLALIRGFPRLRFLTGRTSVLGQALAAGGAGAITGSGSILPKETRAVFEVFRNGGDTGPAQARLNRAGEGLRPCGGIPGMKYSLRFAGLAESFPRPPYIELSGDQKQRASEAWAKYQRQFG